MLIGDGRELLGQEAAATYDYIIIDAFTATGTPEQFISSDFLPWSRTSWTRTEL